jgi:hypothetical protein
VKTQASETMEPMAVGNSQGIFEPPVPVPDDAPLVDRVVAYSGRDPGWPGRR